MEKGIDISDYQTSVNYDKLKADGVEFVIIKMRIWKKCKSKRQFIRTTLREL